MPEVIKVQLELQPCLWTRSGVGTYTFEIARHLYNTDDIEYCGNIFNFLGKDDNSGALNGISIPIRENRMMPYAVFKRTWDFLPIEYEDLFQSNSEISVFFNFVVPPKIRGRVVTVVHDMSYIRCPETMNLKNYKFLKAGLKRSVVRSERIITISQFTKKELMELMDVPEDRISIVYCAPSFSEGVTGSDTMSSNVGEARNTRHSGFSHETLSREKEELSAGSLRERFGIGGPYLLFVSTIEPRKNLVRLIRAFRLLKERDRIPHQLVLAGGPGWRNEEILKEAEPLKERGELIFTGFISDGTKNALYRNADVFVYPSIYEGFGIPPLEAMHLGCPVVAAAAASIPEVVGDAAYLVDPLEEESIAEGILKVLTDKPLAETLRRRGFEREKLFTWEKSAEQFMEVIRGMAEI